ncbi:sensor histidine kinase [Lachnoclostridium phytofermentans]|uniref:histidine kinase n=1 Tax=Lachnoclostridium phytofermentans (strain ATCC 700394 / DSM 18823 / ISDg) TaxID=357809 RepID=A9KPU1_LACP7|nr:HAMP domain-containing sensor histidine kinase [Lachnoclostridium phytofermentans]ABX41840.1 integral membrane sensor signal transduction histidine kinase [Lachnoclostridium phytofermentans ISDg]
MKIKDMFTKNITIKKRLVISNILMILVPVVITAFIGFVCVGIIWVSVTHGMGLGFEDSEDFYNASRNITMIIEKSLEKGTHINLAEDLKGISEMLDKNALTLFVDFSGENLYRYGHTTDADGTLLEAVEVLGGEGFVSNGSRELYIQQSEIDGSAYRIALFASPSELSYNTLKVAIVLSTIILLSVVFFSIRLTNRFLTKFVFQKIERPLDILSNGVMQISNGNLEHRIDYEYQDEFAPVCADFNEMAARLKASVELTEQHEQSRKELLVGISHDLRSPLTSIRAYVEGLLDGVAKTPEAQRGYLEIIRSKAEDIDRMLTKIFLFSKMELGEYPDNPELLYLDDEVRQLVRALGTEYEEKGLVLSAGDLVPATVSADPDQLRRVLTNIMENSVKYKTKDVGTLTISLQEEDSGYRLSLCDDGPGVSEAALPHLFEVFYRSDPSRQNPHRGSGLGLAIAANAIQRMKGTIEAKVSGNGGLEIVICLPKAEV